MSQSYQIAAPAKVNLTLAISGKFPNGLHNLHSLVIFTEQADFLDFYPAHTFRLQINGPYQSGLSADDNLITRAYMRLLDRLQHANSSVCPHYAISLTKKLPWPAGIGSGSSDAAATLLALNYLWDLALSEKELKEIGVSLGADVPMCLDYLLHRRSLWVSGIGDQLSVIDHLPSFKLLLVNNLSCLSTAAVFTRYHDHIAQGTQSYDAIAEPPSGRVLDDLDSFIGYLSQYKNSLQPAAEQLCPSISEVLTFLSETGALFCGMSGSGPSCFALYDLETNESEITCKLKKRFPNWFSGWSSYTGKVNVG